MSATARAEAQRTRASAGQLRAVYAVMRILAEDDRGRGTPAGATVLCHACRRTRAAAGSVQYDGTRLCNGCATEYEVLRISGVVEDLPAFLAKDGGGARGG